MDSEHTPPASAPVAPPGWYPEPGTGRQRYWRGDAWGEYAPPAVGAPVTDAGDGRTIQTVGYVMAGLAIVMPILGVAGLVLGIITATKPGRGGNGAAIISLSVVLGVVGIVLWAAVAAGN